MGLVPVCARLRLTEGTCDCWNRAGLSEIISIHTPTPIHPHRGMPTHAHLHPLLPASLHTCTHTSPQVPLAERERHQADRGARGAARHVSRLLSWGLAHGLVAWLAVLAAKPPPLWLAGVIGICAPVLEWKVRHCWSLSKHVRCHPSPHTLTPVQPLPPGLCGLPGASGRAAHQGALPPSPKPPGPHSPWAPRGLGVPCVGSI